MAVRTSFRGSQTLTPRLELALIRRRKVALVRQTEAAECGLAALAMIANYHGFDIDLGVLRRWFKPSLRGTSLRSLLAMADKIGFSARAVKLDLESLGNLRLPAILHWDMNHFVVLERIKGSKALIHNPEAVSRWISLAEVSNHFTGVALELEPAADFSPVKHRARMRLSQLWQRVTGLKRAIAQTIILSIILEAFVLASPYYMQIAVDEALPALDVNLLTVLAVGFGLFTLINSLASLLRSFVLLSSGTALGYGIATNIARRLFRLPIPWFEKRNIGDILSRFQSVKPIQQFMTQNAVSAMIDGSLAIFTLVIMAFYSVQLTVVALLGFIIYGIVRAVVFPIQRAAQEEAIVAGGREQLAMIESLRGIVTLRLFNQEATRHQMWQERLVGATNANVSLARIGIWQNTANVLILGIETVISIWLAIRLAIGGGFSVGMVFAFMAYKTQFLQRAASLVDQIINFRMLGLHLERLSDIALSDQDKSVSERLAPESELAGRIDLRDISYRYAPSEPLILERLNLTIEPGEHVAITGPSGGGKSTLVKILLSLIEPDQGELLVDGRPLASFGYRNYRDQIAAVLQDDSLFVGSLAENIAMFEEETEMSRIVAAAKAASIHDDIEAMPMRYETLVGDMGSTLSGGQKQRLLLARALFRRPRMLVIDEGTSHLDQAREKRVNEAVAALGITRVIVAHRLETIVSASRVYAVEQGRISEVTHIYDALREKLG